MQPYPTNAAMPVRFMVPPGYRQPYPPFVNPNYDRYALNPAGAYRPQGITRPVNYPPSYGPGGYPQGNNAPTQSVGTQPAGTQPAQRQQAPMQPNTVRPANTVTGAKPGTEKKGFFNPFGNKKKDSIATIPEAKTPVGKKEFKDTAFTIDPDGTKNDSIRGLVSNDDINNLLKHKGTKVKVKKIYRITKTKPEEIDDSSDDDVKTKSKPAPPPPPPVQRPRSSSTDSYCSQCDKMSSHVYDDCPICRAQLQQQQVHVYDDCPQCRAEAQRQTHVYDDCPECRAEWARRQGYQ
ncbi:unnamed protein product [Adineta steineri]|uniref:Uncharacterized protein n=1 Tax=Adineta steineri TaxID=433720 RepID=A0A813TGY8_9BILA|nr:unnamed protein product [Adineta steineri]